MKSQTVINAEKKVTEAKKFVKLVTSIEKRIEKMLGDNKSLYFCVHPLESNYVYACGIVNCNGEKRIIAMEDEAFGYFTLYKKIEDVVSDSRSADKLLNWLNKIPANKITYLPIWDRRTFEFCYARGKKLPEYNEKTNMFRGVGDCNDYTSLWFSKSKIPVSVFGLESVDLSKLTRKQALSHCIKNEGSIDKVLNSYGFDYLRDNEKAKKEVKQELISASE